MKPSIYQTFPRINLVDRKWPTRSISKAPTWCSTDLRDMAQSVPNTIPNEHKVALFELLVAAGIKEIEVGSPGRSESDFKFIRQLIEENLIPSDVTVQVMVQIKDSHIDKALDALQGVTKANLNLYNTTSSLRREDIYDIDGEAVLARAVHGVTYAQQKIFEKAECSSKINLMYSPEGFNTTEPKLLADICRAVIAAVAPNSSRPLIINLLASVETDMPNYFADQIEWLLSQLEQSQHVIYSVQTHNDRGGAVCASEMAMLAGVTRVEGGLFGHGERAGTACLTTMALNLYTQGYDPALELSDLPFLINRYIELTQCNISDRHPYAGELVFSAFSAPKQFAIGEAFKSFCESDRAHWHVPYLPLNPHDIGRVQDDVIRVNSLSGRSGIAYVMEKSHGYQLPKKLQQEFSDYLKRKAQEQGGEILPEQLWELFTARYYKGTKILRLLSISFEKASDGSDIVITNAEVEYQGTLLTLSARGHGPLDGLTRALQQSLDISFEISEYHQHSLGLGSNATAVSYVSIAYNESLYWGVSLDTDSAMATILALISALNSALS